MLKIAYCLYGQPRNLENGHKIISSFIAGYDVDFYYHTWTLNEENYFYSWSYRQISSEELKYDKNIIDKINTLYKPKAYISELSRVFEYENNESFINSLLFHNTNEFNKDKNKISNVFSNYYSKQQVRNLLKKTLENEKIDYDFVIISRFDMLREININLKFLDTKNKVYVSNLHNPRYIFSDAILIMNIENYLNILNVYDNLENLLNNNNVNELVNNYNEKFVFVPESLLFGNYLYYFKNLENIEYIDLPNFV